MRAGSLLVAAVMRLLVASASQNGELPQASDFFVQGLEEVEPAFAKFPGDMYAGRLPMSNGDDRSGMYMFWLFAPHEPVVDDSIVIWLNGGPGCTSFSAGLLMEHSPVTGPFRPAGVCCSSKDDPLSYNPYSWTNATAMLYVEQPVGTGFSTGGPLPEKEEELAGDFYAFYQNFLRVFEEYQQAKVYVVGESYAGMYAPAIARRLYLETKHRHNDDKIPIDLAGVALGNGWEDARVQGGKPIDFAYWHGMIDSYTRDALHAEYQRCLKSSNGKNGTFDSPFHSFTIPDECAVMEAVLEASGKKAWPGNPAGPNTYDVTTWDPYLSILTDGTNEQFYNNPRVKEALHAPKDIHWTGCIAGAGRRRLKRSGDKNEEEKPLLGETLLAHDEPESTIPYIAELLDGADIRVLVYNGDRDMSTCTQGSEQLLNDMEWSGAKTWPKAPRGLWIYQDEDMAGYAKEHRGLGFVTVYNSGHLVPYNQPAHGLDLISRFLLNQTFVDYELPRFLPILAQDDTTATLASTKLLKDATITTARPPTLAAANIALLTFAVVLSFAAGYWVSTLRRKRAGYSRLASG